MMSDQHREMLSVLTEIWELSPDVRLGQLFAHVGFLGEAHLDRSLGYIDDDELLSILYRHRAELRARSEHTLPTTASISVAMPTEATTAPSAAN